MVRGDGRDPGSFISKARCTVGLGIQRGLPDGCTTNGLAKGDTTIKIGELGLAE
jgi:hypothetical protein